MSGLSTYSSEARGSGRSGRSGGSGKSRLSGDAISARGARRSLKRERAGEGELRPGATPTSSPQHPRAQRLPLGLGGRCLLWVPLGLGEKKQNKRSRIREGRTMGSPHGSGGKSRGQRITSTPAVSRSVGDTRGRRETLVRGRVCSDAQARAERQAPPSPAPASAPALGPEPYPRRRGRPGSTRRGALQRLGSSWCPRRSRHRTTRCHYRRHRSGRPRVSILLGHGT